MLIRQILEPDYDVALLMAIGLLASLGFRWMFLRGELKKSVMAVTVFFTFLLIVVCTFGNGIHDLGLIAFPILIAFSSIVLNQGQFIVSSIMSILGLIWLVVGERFGWFTPVPASGAGTGDFIVSSMLVSIGGFIAFYLTQNMKNSLGQADREIEMSKVEAGLLANQIAQKEEIIEEIHKAVINSLAHIRHLTEHFPGKDDELLKVYESLKRKLIVIESAHGILLANQAPIMLNIKDLTREILSRYEQKLTTPVVHVDIEDASCNVSLDQAIHYGIFLIELVHEVDHYCKESLFITLSINKGKIALYLSGFEDVSEENLSVVMDLLTKQLKGHLVFSDGKIVFTFLPSMKK